MATYEPRLKTKFRTEIRKNLQEKFSYIHCEKVFFDAIARYICHYCRSKGSRVRREELLTIALSGSGVNSLGIREIRRIIRENIKPSQEKLKGTSKNN
jgi:hypothetical protein